MTTPPGWVCPRGRPRPNPRTSGREGGGHLPGVAGVCPPSPPTPRCPPGPALGVGARLPRAGPGGGARAAPSVGAAAKGQARAPLGPPPPDPGPPRTGPPRCAPLPPRGLPRRRRGAARPRPHARAWPAGTCRQRPPPAGLATHSPRRPLTARAGRRAAAGHRGRAGACAPRATQSDGPGAARRRRVGTGSAATGLRPAGANGGALPVTRGPARPLRGRAWGQRKRPWCGGALGRGSPRSCALRPGPWGPWRALRRPRARPHLWGPRPRPPPRDAREVRPLPKTLPASLQT